MENYKLLGFRKSKNSKKKYDAILFDDKRRKNYRKRASAKNYHLKKYSPAYFSFNYLW